VCSECGHEEAFFGEGGGATELAEQWRHRMPLGTTAWTCVCALARNNGQPVLISDPDGALAPFLYAR